jgi:FKBP-type peptidyl-prolyl cis-trans isomerase
MPEEGKLVITHYNGWLKTGSKFDSSYDRNEPFSFILEEGMVIDGWVEGLLTMKVGGKRQLVIPPDLAYGETGVPGSIPANATLIFEIELLEIHDE